MLVAEKAWRTKPQGAQKANATRMVRASPRLQSDVNDDEEAELRRLECGTSDGGWLEETAVAAEGEGGTDSVNVDMNGGKATLVLGTAGETVASVVQGACGPSDGAVVQGAAQRRDQLVAKMFSQGGFRETAKISGILPHGGAGLKTKVPKRKEFGEEGSEGDAAHEVYDVLLEKHGGGKINPAATSKLKQLMKALAYLMGQRRINVCAQGIDT